MNSPSGRQERIYVAGHTGMVGSAIVRRLRAAGYTDIVTRDHADLDLTEQAPVRRFMSECEPDFVFLAAARVGGILANNTLRADFLYENLAIQTNVIRAALEAGVERLMFLGSSCVYPRDCPQPIREEYLLTGPFEPTNEPYAVAKVAGLKLCEAFNAQYGTQYVAVMPTNLYGPGDNFDLETAHALPALLHKAHEAKRRGNDVVPVWGSGTPRRDFLFVGDLADACVALMERRVTGGIFNVGNGTDLTLREIAEAVMRTTGLNARLEFDRGRPDGMPRKNLDVSRMRALGWRPRHSLEEGLRITYRWCLDNHVFDPDPADFRGLSGISSAPAS